MNKKCLQCHNDFKSNFSMSKYCSRSCYYKSLIGKKQNKDISGEKNPKWKGGRMTDKNGYILVYSPNHPNKNGLGYVREHRLFMENKLGRLLKKEEVVHHINGVVSDNRVDNLELLKKRDHDRLEYHKRGGLKNNIEPLHNLSTTNDN